jgi:mono/diheme cytochrome c family protein
MHSVTHDGFYEMYRYCKTKRRRLLTGGRTAKHTVFLPVLLVLGFFQVACGDEDKEPTTGKEVYVRQGCARCHGTDGLGQVTLSQVAQKYSREDVMQWIRNPQAVKPEVKMPPYELPENQLRLVVDYVFELSRAALSD